MAKIFLDANFFIDIVEKRQERTISDFLGNDLYISPLSIHILTYMYKYRIPNEKLKGSHKYFILINFTQDITEAAIQGPTHDFEDNVQLHSAADADCDTFLTSDKALLKMTFFGKMTVVDQL